MTVRAKMNTLIAIIAVLVVGLTASIIGVVAATNQTVNPSVRVEYHADTVSATVSAKYQAQGDNGSTNMMNGNKTTITFLAQDGAHPEALSMDSVELNAQNKTYILFSYLFVNNNQTNALRVSLQDNTERNNVNVTYSDSDKLQSSSFSNIVYEMRSDTSRAKTSTSRTQDLTCAVYNPNEASTAHQKTLYVLVEISNYDAKAYYRTSGSSYTISFTLQNISAQ